MATTYNNKVKKGDKQYGVLFNGGKVRARREWRGVKDTLYDYWRWLGIWKIMVQCSMSPGFAKGLFRYRWAGVYLGLPHMIDKFTMGQRDETLRITHTAIDYVAYDVALSIRRCCRGDRRLHNDKEFSRQVRSLR